MNIALDYDDCFTVDSAFWFNVISAAIQHKHKVYIVTFRSPKRCQDLDFHLGLINAAAVGKVVLVPTSLKAKKPFCEALGIKIDVWIDDNPAAVYKDHPACYEKEF